MTQFGGDKGVSEDHCEYHGERGKMLSLLVPLAFRKSSHLVKHTHWGSCRESDHRDECFCFEPFVVGMLFMISGQGCFLWAKVKDYVKGGAKMKGQRWGALWWETKDPLPGIWDRRSEYAASSLDFAACFVLIVLLFIHLKTDKCLLDFRLLQNSLFLT